MAYQKFNNETETLASGQSLAIHNPSQNAGTHVPVTRSESREIRKIKIQAPTKIMLLHGDVIESLKTLPKVVLNIGRSLKTLSYKILIVGNEKVR